VSRPPSLPPGAIAADQLYTLEEAAHRLRWGRRTVVKAQRDGLPTVMYGRHKYVLGSDVLDFFRSQRSNGEGRSA